MTTQEKVMLLKKHKLAVHTVQQACVSTVKTNKKTY